MPTVKRGKGCVMSNFGNEKFKELVKIESTMNRKGYLKISQESASSQIG